MKISIITINQNNAEGLRKTIQSMSMQTFKEYEYIIVDGASTDGSVQIIKQFKEELIQNSNLTEHFKLISEPDSGVFNAMNKGIKMAKGEYILFLNSGDFLVNGDVLEIVFKEHPVEDILCGHCQVSNNNKVIYIAIPPDNFTLEHFFKTTIAHQATFIKRTLFDKFGLYREDLKLMSDWEFWIRTIILGSVTTKKIDVIVSNYNLEGISSDENNKALMSFERSMVWVDLGLKNIIPDYQAWDKEKNDMAVMNWVRSKSILYLPLLFLHNIILKINSIFKK